MKDSRGILIWDTMLYMVNTLLTSLPPATASHQQTIASQQQHPFLPSGGVCHVNQVPYLFQGTVLEHSTFHIGRGVALAAQAAAPGSPRVYKHSSISDSRNDHSFFP